MEETNKDTFTREDIIKFQRKIEENDTIQRQSEYISALQKECRTYYDQTLTLSDELKEAEHKIRSLSAELSLERLKYARLKEKYVRGLSDEQRRTSDTDSLI